MKINTPLDIVAALISSDYKILICQRTEDGSFPLQWEFPGGKVEPGESPVEALQRELVEELAIDVNVERQILSYQHIYPNGLTVNLAFYLVKDVTPEPVNLQFKEIRWVRISELDQYDFLEGDISFINYLEHAASEFLL